MGSRSWSVPRWSRDGILFIAGLLGITNETLFRESPRDALLILFAAMSISPTFLRLDEQNKRRHEESPPPPKEKEDVS